MLRTQLCQCSKRLANGSPATRAFTSFSKHAPRTALIAKRRELRVTSYNAWTGQYRKYAVAAEDTDKGVDPSDSFLQGNTANYVDEMYMAWKQDPSSVHISWQAYFKNMESGDMPTSRAFTPPPTIVPNPVGGPTQSYSQSAVRNLAEGMSQGQGSDITNHLKVQLLVRAYQARGHHKAKIDPLGIRNQAKGVGHDTPRELELENYNFSESDMEQEFELGPGILPRFRTESRTTMKLRDIIDTCERLYCSSYGVEYIHISDRDQCDWLRQRIEVPQPYKYSVDDKRRILDRLIWSSSFESFLATKYPNDKRFGLEGGESLIPGMKALIDRSGNPHEAKAHRPAKDTFCLYQPKKSMPVPPLTLV